MVERHSAIANKLLWLGAFIAFAFALVAVIVGVAFRRVESLSAGVASTQMASVVENAALGRALSTTFSEIELISRRCPAGEAFDDSDRQLIASLASIAVRAQDRELLDAIAVLSTATTQLLDECALIGRSLVGIRRIDGQVLADLTALETLISRSLIDRTLAGKATDHLDQVMTLIVGFRETVLAIGKRVAERSAYQPNATSEREPVGALIGDLALRLQTLTASTPDVARIGRRLSQLVAEYRAEFERFESATARFHDVHGRSRAAKESVLASMKRLDIAAADRAGSVSEEIRRIVGGTLQRVLGLSAIVALLALLAIAWIVRRNINRPLKEVLRQIDAIRDGVPMRDPEGAGNHEWSTIERALHDMSTELARSRNLLRQIIDAAPIRVFWKDRESRYLGCNPAFAHDAGKAGPADVVGRDDFALGWADQAERYRADDRQVMESGAPKLSYEEPQTTPDGRTIWLRTSKVPLKNRGNETIGVLGIYDDITARKRIDAELEQHRHHLEELVQQRTVALMETEAKASHILQSAADGLYGVDRRGHITFMNPAGCTMLGYRAEDVIGRSAHALFHHSRPDGTPYPAAECPVGLALHEGRELRVDNETYWHADGHGIPVMYAVHPIKRDGAISGAVTSFVDISEQRAAAQAREQALVAAENLARARREFLANMSHEIRTPLNGVLGFAQIGHRNFRDSDKARMAFEKILDSGNLLLRVINDVLDFSKIEAGKIAVEHTEVDLALVIDRAVGLVREAAQAKRLELRLELAPDLPRTCIGDPLRIGQVLLNLLGNAVKFTTAGSVILSASVQDNELAFRIVDTGIGMDEAQLARLFDPFQQADGSTTRKFGGTGLGLAISKRIVELMHGDIRIESRAGVGTTVLLRLPLVPAPMAAAAPVPCDRVEAVRSQPSLAGVSILVVEDDAVNQLVLEANLAEYGADVVVAGNGREAIERLERNGGDAYDVVLMDIEMPGLDGYGTTRAMLELCPGMVIIGQTAHAFSEAREKCLAVGMVGHVSKPIDMPALVGLIGDNVEANAARNLPTRHRTQRSPS